MLCELSGMDAVTLQPAAGAQAEYLGARIISAYHASNGEQRTEMLVPDTAHGTNPASSAMAGFHIVELPSGADGTIDMAALEAALSERTAGLMLTNPNTLGIFESSIDRIADSVHGAGGLLYYDGANLNGIMGHSRPGDMGFDLVHFNFHKTFSTPHGGGGPGAGALGVKRFLEPFLPVPRIVQEGDAFALSNDAPLSVGKVRAYQGNFGIMVRAYAYLYSNWDVLPEIASKAVLNANYLMHLLKDSFEIPYLAQTPLRKHEFVISCESIKKETGCGAMDIAHRLLDYGFHAPTVQFPLIVREALMVEPTESESRETIEQFAQALIRVKQECYEKPEIVRTAPHQAARSTLDLLEAAKHPRLSHRHGLNRNP
jgi:glycine dehydrogenase subunit 2